MNTPAQHAILTELASLIEGSVAPTPATVVTDSGKVRLTPRGDWFLYRIGRVDRLGGWRDPVEDVAATFWFVAGERGVSERAA